LFQEKQVAMSVLAKFPITLADRLELGPDTVRFPASWEEYLDLLGECEYQIEYANHEIIAMSIASKPHEAIVANILIALGKIFEEQPDFLPLGSNRHVFIEEFSADYSPDVSVLKGEEIEYVLRKGLTAYTNPHIIFEVLSPSTREIDLGEKLPRYKKISSVQQIIFIEQSYPLVMVFKRIADSTRWENEDFDTLEQSFLIEGQEVRIKDLYKKVIMTPPTAQMTK
jgi:Uma2 family endonuclease